MPWIRQLPSGLWAATVYSRPGDPTSRITESHDLRGTIAKWAAEQERHIADGDWIDPRAGRITVGEWYARCVDARHRELATRRREASSWRCHVKPAWSQVPLSAILKPDIGTWVEGMKANKVGAATIESAIGVLRTLLEQAVDAKLLRSNSALGVKAPRRDAHLDRVLEPDEDNRLLAALDRLFPGRPDGRLMVELMLYCGLRWEEAGALDRAHVDTRRAVLTIGPVLERDGTIRPYPKSPAGIRPVPVDRDLWPRVRARAMAVPPDGLLVTSPAGIRLDYSRWHERVWTVALMGRPEYAGAKGHPPRAADPGAELEGLQPTPHDLRHSYGTRLGEEGVPPHEIMALMGHSSLAAVQRYLHAGDGRFDRARDAVRRGRKAQ